MQQYLDSIKLSLTTNNYFGAITIALTLPDICAYVNSSNNKTSSKKYCKWFDKYLGKYYSEIFIDEFKNENTAVVNLIAQECYATRCSLLHQGTHHIRHQRILDDAEHATVSSVHFMSLGYGAYLRNGDILFLDVDFFCENMINAVETWMRDISSDRHKMKKIAAMPIIHKTFESIVGSTN
ncbi:hypothetical protein [Acinetobacter beijerinckii]|uniref:Uncharacterized protein n=1 Tax=Acinetobacter beijerinckii ANC 3835 TaxID=1217649 RepID=N9E5J9_9GAMM|nr:hypothetical protein [Acinetobacter beijerinckii]ENW05768.1 hypothetical protein F934_01125 [Acinetobacter beijerinckii ANC 3835]